MERAEFIVETGPWKNFYKMSYNGDRSRMLAFSSLVEGTIQEKLGVLFPELEAEVKNTNLSTLEPFVNELTTKSKKIAKLAGLDKKYKGFAEMWVARELMMAAGLKIVPEKKELRKILKKI